MGGALEAVRRLSRLEATAALEPDRGEAAVEGEFFRSREFLEAEGATHSLVVERGPDRVAVPLIVREIEGAGGVDATSPYSYPGGRVAGEPIEASTVDWRGTGLVSAFVRDRLGQPTAFASPTRRATVLVADPELPRKSRMSDRQQIRKNEAAGYTVWQQPGPETSDAQRADFHRVYTETMQAVGAAERYLFDASYFDLLWRCPLSTMFTASGPEGDVAAAAIVVRSDGFLHYYLSGTAEAHRRAAPSKNLISAVTDHAEALGMPVNLGGGLSPGDGLEEFKRGFANRELAFHTHELICDPERYAELSAGRGGPGGDFFPLYRAGR